MSGVSVTLEARANGDDRHPYNLSAVADRNGEFAVGPVEEFRWIAFICGDPVADWALYVDTAEGRKALLRQGGIGMPLTKLDIQCDVSMAGVALLEAFGPIEGKCSMR